MARPRVFISSTYYDLKHLRSGLENFVESLGFDPVLSEKGNIPYSPDVALDASCYREVENTDIFVLILGGRYGSERSDGNSEVPKGFYDQYESITKGEFKVAVERNIPTYIAIERPVYADYETYLRNKDNTTVVYAHADSVNIFRLLEEIVGLPRNNPVLQFDRYNDIESWLREQWSGLFRDLLHRRSEQQQLTSLAAQIQDLAEVNKTLKVYLEEVVTRVAPKESEELIQKEDLRLVAARKREMARHDPVLGILVSEPVGLNVDALIACIENADNSESFVACLRTIPMTGNRSSAESLFQTLEKNVDNILKGWKKNLASDADHDQNWGQFLDILKTDLAKRTSRSRDDVVR